MLANQFVNQAKNNPRAIDIYANIFEDLVSNVLYPQDNLSATGIALAASVLGKFKYQLPNNLQVINNEFSNYTIFRQEMANAVVSKQNTVNLIAYRELDELNTLIANFITNDTILKLFQNYTKEGGMFMLVTPVGIMANLVIQSLTISFIKTNPVFNFSFRQMKVSETIQSQAMDIRKMVCL